MNCMVHLLLCAATVFVCTVGFEESRNIRDRRTAHGTTYYSGPVFNKTPEEKRSYVSSYRLPTVSDEYSFAFKTQYKSPNSKTREKGSPEAVKVIYKHSSDSKNADHDFEYKRPLKHAVHDENKIPVHGRPNKYHDFSYTSSFHGASYGEHSENEKPGKVVQKISVTKPGLNIYGIYDEHREHPRKQNEHTSSLDKYSRFPGKKPVIHNSYAYSHPHYNEYFSYRGKSQSEQKSKGNSDRVRGGDKDFFKPNEGGNPKVFAIGEDEGYSYKHVNNRDEVEKLANKPELRGKAYEKEYEFGKLTHPEDYRYFKPGDIVKVNYESKTTGDKPYYKSYGIHRKLYH